MFDFGEKHSHFCRTALEVDVASLIGKWGGLVGDSEKKCYLCADKTVWWSVARVSLLRRGISRGKSGQHRASHFLTGSWG